MLKEEQSRAIAGFNSILVWSSGWLVRLWVLYFFSSFSKMPAELIVFTINKGVTFKPAAVCMFIGVLWRGWRLLLGWHRPPWGSFSQSQ